MQQLADAARSYGVQLTPLQQEAFDIYYNELIAWNSRMNLTSIVEREQVIVKHFLDSLSLAPLLHSASPAFLIDVGTGAGFPGLPLKIAFPNLHLTLLEATRKKVDFLKYVAAKLELADVLAMQGRAEDLGQDPAHREHYDFAVARAVADLTILLEYALPFVRVGGSFIAQKGIQVDEELRNAEKALHVLGGHLQEIVPVQLPGLEPRHLIVVNKIAPTPATYPRRAGIPERKPLR